LETTLKPGKMITQPKRSNDRNAYYCSLLCSLQVTTDQWNGV